MAICRYTVAVDRPKKKGEEKAKTDFIRCVSFGKSAEFASNYFTKGLRVLVSGRLQIGSYKNKDGTTISTADVVVESQEFADAKKEKETNVADGFVDISDNASENPYKGFEDINASDDELPFE